VFYVFFFFFFFFFLFFLMSLGREPPLSKETQLFLVEEQGNPAARSGAPTSQDFFSEDSFLPFFHSSLRRVKPGVFP